MKTIFFSSSKNNIFVVLTNSSGELLYKDSGGSHCKRGSERKTPKIAEKIQEKLIGFLEKNFSTTESYLFKYRNPRYIDRGRMTRQVKFIIKNWPAEVNLKEIIDANKIIKTAVRYRARRRV